jgi:lipoprotein-anchoring transpeptidase ErfK/SrfK
VRVRAGAILFALLALAGSSPGAAAARGSLPGRPTSQGAWVAHIVIPTPALAAPGHGARKTTIPTVAGWDGGPVALLVLGARMLPDGRTWLRVLLPQRPNGSSAWINSNLVRLTRTPWRIDVSTERRTVTLLRGGRVMYSWLAVVGKPSTPTPRGLFSVYMHVPQPSPNDFVGTWALMLSAYSDVLRSFDGGPGEVAIHGRGGASLLDPLGSARSHGCIRIDNSAVDILARDAAEGTPVRIT